MVMASSVLRLAAVALLASLCASNPAEKVVSMMDGLQTELGSESASKMGLFKTEESDCKVSEDAAREKVDTKDAEVRSVMDKIADEEKLSSALGLGLKKLQAESGASEVLVSMNVERLKGVTGNLGLANKTAGASAEQHLKKMKSLQKAYGVVQTLIQFVKRAFERQASGKVHPAPGAAPQAGEVGHVALDTTNPKEVGIRGALDAASPDRGQGGDGVHGLESAVQYEKDLKFSETTTSPPEVATETGDHQQEAPEATATPLPTMSFKRVFSKVFAANGPLASHRHSQTAVDLMKAVEQFQAGGARGRALLAEASPAVAAQKKSGKHASKIYELMQALSQTVKVEHDSELESNARTTAAGDKLMRALLKQRATIQAVLLKEAARNLKAKVDAAEKDISGHQKVIQTESKKLAGLREDLMRFTTDLDDQHQKCKGVSSAKTMYDEDTTKQKGIMGEISGIIKDRVAKVKALVDKNIKEAAGLIKAATEPAI